MNNTLKVDTSFIFNNSNSLKEIDKFFTELVRDKLPREFVSYVKQIVYENNMLLNNNFFHLELIVDTNIILQEVRSLALCNSSFFMKIADNPYIKIYAPPELKEELYKNIKLKFPIDKKTRELNIDECLQKADLILSKIIIRDDKTQHFWNKSEAYLKERNADKDIPFLTLGFSLNAHGIITNDKDFTVQTEVKLWTLHKVGQVITELNNGAFSITIIGVSLTPIREILVALKILIWRTFLQKLAKIRDIIVSICVKGLQFIAEIPPNLLLFIGLTTVVIAVILTLSENLRQQTIDFLKIIKDEIKKLIHKIQAVCQTISAMLGDFIEAIKPYVKISTELIFYFIIQAVVALQWIEELKTMRPLQEVA